MEHLFEKFENEKITLDIIGSLSSYEMEYLGIDISRFKFWREYQNIKTRQGMIAL